MELRQFVKDALLAIVEGVKDAQSASKEHINPEPSHRSEKFASDYVTSAGLRAYSVKFDVAVTVTSEGSKEGGGKVSVWSVASIEDKAASKDIESTVSRLQFQVPVAFAYGDSD